MGKSRLTLANEAALRGASEAAAIDIIAERGGGPGLRLANAGGEAAARLV